MKVTKEVLILAIPLMAAGCGGSSNPFNPPPPPGSADPEGIYQGQAGNGDTIFGIVTADGTADFLQFPGTLANLTDTTPFVILAPKNIVPDENGNYSVSYDGYSGNGYTLPSGDITETGTLSGLAIPASSLSGSYTVTGPIPAGMAVNPQSTSTINYNLSYAASYYEAQANASLAAGNYTVSVISGTTVYSGGTFTITAGTSSTQAVLAGTDGQSPCNYSGTVTIPDTSRNAYEFSIQAGGTGCVLASGSFTGLGTLLTVNSVPTMFTILSNSGTTSQGMLVLLTKVS